MKKTLFAAALASVALAGCVKNEAEIVQNADSKITFAAPLVSSITRVYTGEITNPYPDTEKFVVFAKLYSDKYDAWSNGTPYMGSDTEGVEVKYNPDANIKGWTPNIDYYWPKNGKLTFYAYSPSDYDSWKPLISSGQMKSSEVTIPNDTHNVDLLYSELAKDKQANDNNNGNNVTPPTPGTVGSTEYNGVELKFKHALSSIKFKVKLSRHYESAEIVLKSIVLKNVKSKGNFSWNINSATATPQWGMTSDPLEYTLVSGSTQTINSEIADVDNAASMILLPQNLTSVVASVTYTITDGAGQTREFTTDINLGTLTHGSQDNAEWILGKRYIYTITFSLQTIIFDPSVTPWEDVEVVYPKTSTSAAA